MVFFNFLNFFLIFLELFIPGQVKTHRNDFFFLNFLLRVGKERNGTERKFLFYLIHILFQPIFAKNDAILVFFLYFEFFGYFFEILYYALGRNETER